MCVSSHDARSYGSLHQKDAEGQRTKPEQAAFGTALKTMGMWYAHRLTNGDPERAAPGLAALGRGRALLP